MAQQLHIILTVSMPSVVLSGIKHHHWILEQVKLCFCGLMNHASLNRLLDESGLGECQVMNSNRAVNVAGAEMMSEVPFPKVLAGQLMFPTLATVLGRLFFTTYPCAQTEVYEDMV